MNGHAKRYPLRSENVHGRAPHYDAPMCRRGFDNRNTLQEIEDE